MRSLRLLGSFSEGARSERQSVARTRAHSSGGSRRGGTTSGPLSTGALRTGIVYERPALTRVLRRPFAWRIAVTLVP